MSGTTCPYKISNFILEPRHIYITIAGSKIKPITENS